MSNITAVYTPLLFFSALIALLLAVFTWRKRAAPGAVPLFLMLITTFIWAAGYGAVLVSSEPSARYFWLNVLIFGSLWGTPAFWAFGLEYTNRERWLTRRNITLMCIPPVLVTLLAWTNPLHYLFYSSLDINSPEQVFIGVPGPAYLFYLFYAYSVVFFTIAIITIAYFRALPLYRLQSGTILAGTLTPLVGNILFNVIIDQSSRYIDPTPLLFTIMCIFYAQGLFGFRLFDVIPIARDSLIEHMSDGVVVVDTKKRIVDINPAALRELNTQNGSPIGRQLSAFFGHWPLEWVDQNFHQAAKIEISGGTTARYFELSIEPLFNWRRHFIGSLFVLRDITSHKQSEVALQKAKDGLQDQIDKIQVLQSELRDQAERDALTGLYNRRYLTEIMPLKLLSTSSQKMPLSVIMIDIDHFKEFNDKFGHEAGDIVLQALADMLRNLSRIGDVICRYGGEEFVIVLPNISQDSALHRAEEWCDACKQLNLVFGGKKAGITLSVGVAVFPRHGITAEDLLRNADDAMYHSKRTGRNKVSVAETAF